MSSSRKKWCRLKMENAVNSVLRKEMGFLKASRAYGVPKSTLKDFVHKLQNQDHSASDVKKIVNVALGRKPVLPNHLEAELVKYCLDMDKNYFGLKRTDIRRMAFELAIRNGIPHPFSSSKAGKKWLSLFQKRHPELSFRTPQSISVARVQAFTRDNINAFYAVLKPELEKVKFQPNRIFNVDETGITIVQHKPQKILTLKGKKEVHKLSSAERGGLITIVTCMSAGGKYVPPMMIFPRKNMKNELKDGAPADALVECCQSGWITPQLFTKWFIHFVNQVHASKDDPVVLIFDGHYSHTRNIELINLARENYISLVCLPPHTSHKMQPLDISFMKPFKSYYSSEIEKWMDNHEGRTVTHYQITSLFTAAYERAATITVAKNGFKSSGIFPFNPDIFEEHEFIAAAHEDILEPERSPVTPVAETILSTDDTLVAGPSTKPVTVSELLRIPRVPSAPPSTRKGSAQLVTSSPYKKKLLDAQRKKEEKEAKKKMSEERKRTTNKPGTSSSKQKKKTKRRLSSESSQSDEEVEYASSTESEDDALCQFCKQSYKNDNQGQEWISCRKCFEWSHKACDAAYEDNKKKYVCTLCLNDMC